MLRASAGSGKTTTIVEATRRLPAGTKVKFLAFNKNIQTELESRLAPGTACRTFHSDGLAALNKLFGGNALSTKSRRTKIDAGKVRSILPDVLKPSQLRLYASPIVRLVSYAKSAGLGTEVLEDTWSEWQNLLTHFSLQLDDEAQPQTVIALAQKVLLESNNRPDVLDFDDMLYLALKLNATFEPFDIVFIDEAQDTNAVQRALLKRMLQRTPNAPCGLNSSCPPYSSPSRLIAVGDPSQAIYGFRGADADAMTALRDEFNMTVLPLSVSYRCSKAVVAEAQNFETTL